MQKRRMRATRGLATIALLLWGAVSLTTAAEMRTWNDPSGKFHVEAELLRVEGSVVHLQCADGRTLEIELARLSEADRQYVAAQAASPLVVEEDSAAMGFPAVTLVRPPGARCQGNPEALAGLSPPPERSRGRVAIRASLARAISPQVKGEWRLTLSAPPPRTPLEPCTIALPPRRSFFEHGTALLTSRAAPVAVLGYYWDGFGGPPSPALVVPVERRLDLRSKDVPARGTPAKPFSPAAPSDAPLTEEQVFGKGSTRLVLCNLRNGHYLEMTWPGHYVPLALSERGTEVLMQSEAFGRHGCLTLCSLTASGLVPTMEWVPYQYGPWANKVTWAEFLDAEHLVTLGSNGRLVVWQLNPLKPQYYLSVDPRATPALSPDRRYLVCSANEDVGVLDLSAGKVLATMPLSRSLGWAEPRFAFSPSGKRLACHLGERIVVWDFAEGELRRKLYPDDPWSRSGPFLWTNENYLLAGTLLLGADSQIKLWRYRGLSAAAFCAGQCLLLVDGSRPPMAAGPGEGQDQASALMVSDLPQPGVLDSLKRATEDPAFAVLRPGGRVRLNVEGVADAAMRDKVRALLTENVQSQGFRVAEHALVELRASTSFEGQQKVRLPGSDVTARRSLWGVQPEGGRTVQALVHRSRLELVCETAVVWGDSAINLCAVDGGSSEPALQGQDGPNYGWFGTVRLPKTAVKSVEGGTFGASELTVHGLQ